MYFCIADVANPPVQEGLSVTWIIIIVLLVLGLVTLFVMGKLKRRRIAEEERAAAMAADAPSETKE